MKPIICVDGAPSFLCVESAWTGHRRSSALCLRERGTVIPLRRICVESALTGHRHSSALNLRERGTVIPLRRICVESALTGHRRSSALCLRERGTVIPLRRSKSRRAILTTSWQAELIVILCCAHTVTASAPATGITSAVGRSLPFPRLSAGRASTCAEGGPRRGRR